MLRTITAVVCLFAICGCQRQASKEEATRLLAGKWILQTARNCAYGAVQSDQLVLHEHGGMEQHLILKDGRVFSSTNEHWSFIPPTNIGLEARWGYPAGARDPVKESESLVIEFTRPPTIVINPDSNCFYMKVE